eukprot:2754459-Rhodomonas_salina.1
MNRRKARVIAPAAPVSGANSAIGLRTCCAMSAIGLRACYAMSGTDTAYAAQRRSLRRWQRGSTSRRSKA